MHVQCNGFDVYIEGLIYNMPSVEIMISLSRVIENLANGSGDTANHIRRFVDAADGDYFVVCISSGDWESGGGRYIALNDKYSRLPIYWCSFASKLIVSRDLNFVLSLINPSINTWGLAEYMVFSHTLGEKTIFNSIHRTKQSRAFWSRDRFQGSHSIPSSSNWFDGCSQYNTDQDSCALEASILFEESCGSRVARLEPLGRSFVTLSGGFDSRTVYAGIRKAGSHALPVTFVLITGDESKYAQGVAAEFEDDLEYVEVPNLRLQDVDDVQGAKDIIRFTEGQEPLHHCYPNFPLSQSLAGRFPDTGICYLGFGGEWLRHPYKPKRWQRTIRDILWNWRRSIAMLCQSSDICNENNVYSYLESEIRSACRGYDPESIMKWMYYQYYNGFVLSGEERCRLHHWTVSPLLSLDLVDFYIDCLPLEYADLSDYIKFMTLVDKRTGAVDTNHVSLSRGKVTDVTHSVASNLREIVRNSKVMCTIGDTLLSTSSGRLVAKAMGVNIPGNSFGLQDEEISLIHKAISDMRSSVHLLSGVFSANAVTSDDYCNFSLDFLDKLFTVYAYVEAITGM